MRTVGLVYMGLFVVAVTTFLGASASSTGEPDTVDVEVALAPPDLTMPAIPEAPPAPEARDIPLPTSPAPAAREVRVPAPPHPEVQEAPRETRTRNRWRRSYNRYPGPIPTPDEWEPPEGPVRIALQAGHWRADEAPRELSGLRGAGTSWDGTHEWQANLVIAERAASMLEELGYEVDVLPAVIPPSYRAHLFISIHADGSNDPNASGYRVAAPRRDATGRASHVVDLLGRSYGEVTGLRQIPTVTRRMQNYYAFNFRRYEHALHPMTIAVILETGFLTSARDRTVIMSDPDRAARGIVEAVAAFPITPPPLAEGTR